MILQIVVGQLFIPGQNADQICLSLNFKPVASDGAGPFALLLERSQIAFKAKGCALLFFTGSKCWQQASQKFNIFAVI